MGAKYQSDDQRADVAELGRGIASSGLLDYVALWYLKAADFIRNTAISCAFVSTNSITQGEQVGVLWGELFRRGVKIHFAHRTFSWQSEARGKAHVHVVIIGFGLTESPTKTIFDYEQDPQQPQAVAAKNISPYLVDGPDLVVLNRNTPLCDVPDVDFGSMPNDGGFLLFDDQEKSAFLALEPAAEPYFRSILGSVEFINKLNRWCLWLADASPTALRSMPEVLSRIDAVKAQRLASPRLATKKLASTPAVFGEIRQPSTRYLGIPKTSSEKRRYVPMGFLEPNTIANSELFTSSNATIYHFGILTSSMHNSWIRQIAGRLKSDPRYSVKLVYNNFPWPETPTDKQRASVEAKAKAVLDVRAKYPESSLADLYDPLTMPPDLQKAHTELDRAVEACYRKAAFNTDRERVEFLFALYEKLTAPLTAGIDSKPKKSRKKAE